MKLGNTWIDLSKRVTVSSLVIAVVLLLILFSSVPWVSILLALIVAALAGVGVWEYANMAKVKELKVAQSAMVVLSIVQALVFFISYKFLDRPLLPVVSLAGSVVIFCLIHFKDMSNAVANVAIEFFSICYVVVPLGFILGILFSFYEAGKWWVIYAIAVTKITDVGGYFIGKFCGKHKLARLVSPSKTIEGAIAGFVCAVGGSLAFYFLGKAFSNGAFSLTLISSIWLGMLIGILAQIGDLSESLFKRDASIKDSNHLPGLGGVLDMIDSLVFTVPLVYFFLYLR